MKELLILLWIVGGFISVWRGYHGLLKHWWDHFRESYWEQPNTALLVFLGFSPLFILGGLFSVYLVELLFPTSWWFTTKNKK